jgi:hypothetical protein
MLSWGWIASGAFAFGVILFCWIMALRPPRSFVRNPVNEWAYYLLIASAVVFVISLSLWLDGRRSTQVDECVERGGVPVGTQYRIYCGERNE